MDRWEEFGRGVGFFFMGLYHQVFAGAVFKTPSHLRLDDEKMEKEGEGIESLQRKAVASSTEEKSSFL